MENPTRLTKQTLLSRIGMMAHDVELMSSLLDVATKELGILWYPDLPSQQATEKALERILFQL